MREQQVDVNGIKLQVRDYEHEGETIIFLHYGSGNLMMWQGVVPYFQDTYRLVLIDLRGHGKSDSPQDGYHIDQMAADVAGVMAHLDLASAHVVGSSLGAEVGLSLAANYPDKVVSLVCEGALYSEYGPYGIQSTSEETFREEVARKLAKIRETPETVYATAEELVTATRQDWEQDGFWNANLEAVVRYGIHKIATGEYTPSWRKWARERYLTHYYAYRFEEYYRRVTCPVLMLPAEDEMENEEMRKAMEGFSQLARSCKIVLVPGAVHAAGWMLFPQRMSEAVLGFLAEV
jgi:2-succinyl-6-hydroxy-2,4-cyclohexadiene-1-carboxylate synthase